MVVPLFERRETFVEIPEGSFDVGIGCRVRIGCRRGSGRCCRTLGLCSDVVVHYDRLRIIVRDRASDGRGPDGWSHVVGVAVRRVASVEIAGRQRAESPTDASPNDR